MIVRSKFRCLLRETLLSGSAPSDRFQLHFRPGHYSGEIDAEIAAIIFFPVEKYRLNALRGLLQLEAESAASGLD